MSTRHLDTYVHSSQKPSVRQQTNMWSIQAVEHHLAIKRSECRRGLNTDEAGDAMLRGQPQRPRHIRLHSWETPRTEESTEAERGFLRVEGDLAGGRGGGVRK